MSDLKSFAVLQARVYEFLEQQDEATLQAIVSGEVRLAALPSVADPPSTDLTVTPPSDLPQELQDLAKLASEHERRTYLSAAKLTVKGLQNLAKQLRLTRYSKLSRAELIDLLARRGRTDQTKALVDEPRTPVDGNTVSSQPAATTPEAPPPPAVTAEPNADVAAITARLSETETEAEGAAYLKSQHVDRETLLAVAAELQLTRVERLTQSELQKKVLRQAIGARRRFAGLRKW